MFKNDLSSVSFHKQNNGRPLRRIIRDALYLIDRTSIKVLDIGCGYGYDVFPLLRIGANVTALDKDQSALTYIRDNVPRDLCKRLTIVCGNIEDVDINDSFDLINAHASLDFANPEFIKNDGWKLIKKLLNQDGLFCATIFLENDVLAKQSVFGFTDDDLVGLWETLYCLKSEFVNFPIGIENKQRSLMRIIACKM